MSDLFFQVLVVFPHSSCHSRCLLPTVDIKAVSIGSPSVLKRVVDYLIQDCIYVNIDFVRSPPERVSCDLLQKRGTQSLTQLFLYWTVCRHTQAVLPLMIFGGIFGGIGSLLLVASYTCYPVGVIIVFPCYFLGGALQFVGMFTFLFTIPLEVHSFFSRQFFLI